jgi:cystathionine beta-lyase
MNEVFDDVDVARLRRRRTVKWTLYGPEVLAAWVAEMDFDVAPVVRAALLEAVEREDFGYSEGDLTELATACAEFFAAEHGWVVPPTRIFAVADVLAGIATALDVFVPPGAQVLVPTPAYPPFFEVVALTGREAPPPRSNRGRPSDPDLDRAGMALRAGAGGAPVQPAQPDRACSPRRSCASSRAVDRHEAHRGRAPRAVGVRTGTARRTRRCLTPPPSYWSPHLGVEGVQHPGSRARRSSP